MTSNNNKHRRTALDARINVAIIDRVIEPWNAQINAVLNHSGVHTFDGRRDLNGNNRYHAYAR